MKVTDRTFWDELTQYDHEEMMPDTKDKLQEDITPENGGVDGDVEDARDCDVDKDGSGDAIAVESVLSTQGRG